MTGWVSSYYQLAYNGSCSILLCGWGQISYYHYATLVIAPEDRGWSISGFIGWRTHWWWMWSTNSWGDWMIAMPWWMMFLPGLGLWWVAGQPERRGRRRQKLGLCVQCGYDLRGTPGHCPECGRSSEMAIVFNQSNTIGE